MDNIELNIESKFSNQIINLVRLVSGGLLILVLIFVLPINLNATIVFSLTLLLIILYSAKSKIIVTNDSIIFETNRLFKFLSSTLLISIDEIENLEYFPKRINVLILLLPGLGGIKNAEYIFRLKDKRQISRVLKINKNDTERLIYILDEKIKIIMPKR